MADYAEQYSRSIRPSLDPESAAFLRPLAPHGPHGELDHHVASLFADYLDDIRHPASELLRLQPQRIRDNDFRAGRGGPSGRFSHFHPLAVDHGLLFGITRPGIQNNWAGIDLHAIPVNPDHPKATEMKLTRQALGTRVYPYSYNKVLGHTAAKEFTDRLPEGRLKTAMEALLETAPTTGHYFNGLFEHDRQGHLVPPNPQTDAEHQAAVHYETTDDTHAENYGKWLEEQGDPIGSIIRHHVRRWGGQPTRHNQMSELYGNYHWFPHRGGLIGVGPPRMYNGQPSVDIYFSIPHPSGEEWPRHPTSNHLVPARLSWNQYMPVYQAEEIADRLPESVREPMKASLARVPRPDEE